MIRTSLEAGEDAFAKFSRNDERKPDQREHWQSAKGKQDGQHSLDQETKYEVFHQDVSKRIGAPIVFPGQGKQPSDGRDELLHELAGMVKPYDILSYIKGKYPALL